MNEQLQRLASPAGRSSLALQIRTFDVPPAARGQLSAIFRHKELTPKTTESHWSGGQREP